MTIQNWFADAPPLPFVPFKGVAKEELSVLFTGYKPLTNRRRVPPRLQLAQALMCFCATTAALIATSREGERRITAWAPVVQQKIDTALGSSKQPISRFDKIR
ncbi:hypothetical protein [Luteolibacter luteus]|uniref:Uncharacterized protein n=1 Tax=Luteolibacter luteus TaxID=2728835 RepID=A0A858RGY5_9BACT|nr:hypothetical protein [Luteolibacter luteus]QJE95540.1 hypothetical protein HHL09_06995 [Luteolibacter luteus]